MGRMIILVVVGLFLFSGQAMAQPLAKHLVDSKPGEAVLISLGEWFASHPVQEGNARVDNVYQSSRGMINLLTLKGPNTIARHLHTTVDEIVYVYKGSGEMNINGKWVAVKAGDFHVCPRGVAHSTRAKAGEELCAISIFTPPMPAAGDRVSIE